LGFLFENIAKEEYFQKFFADKYQMKDIEQIKVFGEKLKKNAHRRNDAAHGGNYLEYKDVCEDKRNVYDAVKEYRGMILELLEILFPRKNYESI